MADKPVGPDKPARPGSVSTTGSKMNTASEVSVKKPSDNTDRTPGRR